MTGSPYEQMKKAMLSLGRYSMEDGTYVNAEIVAYSVSIGLVKDYFQKILREIFVDTAEDYGLNMFEDLFFLKMPRTDLTARRKQIKTYLSLQKGSFNLEFFLSEFSRCGSENGYAFKDGKVDFLSVEQAPELFHIQLCSLLTRYSQFLADYSIKGHGKTCNEKDAGARSWNYMDSAMMSFSVHDTL